MNTLRKAGSDGKGIKWKQEGIRRGMGREELTKFETFRCHCHSPVLLGTLWVSEVYCATPSPWFFCEFALQTLLLTLCLTNSVCYILFVFILDPLLKLVPVFNCVHVSRFLINEYWPINIHEMIRFSSVRIWSSQPIAWLSLTLTKKLHCSKMN